MKKREENFKMHATTMERKTNRGGFMLTVFALILVLVTGSWLFKNPEKVTGKSRLTEINQKLVDDLAALNGEEVKMFEGVDPSDHDAFIKVVAKMHASSRHIDQVFEEGRTRPSRTLNPKYKMLIWLRGDLGGGRSIIGDPVNLNVVTMAGRTEVSPNVLKQLRKKSGVADLEVRLLSADEFVSKGLAKSHRFTNREGQKWITLYSPGGNFVASNN